MFPEPMSILRQSRRSAGLLLAVFLTAQSASYLHLLIVHHGICEAHGELTEELSPTARPSTPVESRDHRPTLAALAGESPDHHCFATACRRESVQPIDSSATLTFTNLGHEIATPILEPFPSVAILRFAPKHSPPVA